MTGSRESGGRQMASDESASDQAASDQAGSDRAALRRELKQVEDLIAQARNSAADIHEEIGGQEDGTLDSAETSELFSATQEQEALLGELEGRRDELRRRLGMDS